MSIAFMSLLAQPSPRGSTVRAGLVSLAPLCLWAGNVLACRRAEWRVATFALCLLFHSLLAVILSAIVSLAVC